MIKQTSLFRSVSASIVLLTVIVTSATAATPPLRPNPKLTPGATMSVTLKSLCTPGRASAVRNVPQSERNAVYKEYGITSHPTGEFEVDHLISLELGGSNDIKNLWPQSYKTTPWNAHVKDKLENRLHALVCHGKVSLPDAQKAISGDWIAAYQKYIGKTP